MITYFFVKPESLHFITDENNPKSLQSMVVGEINNNPLEPELNVVRQSLLDGINILGGKKITPSKNLLYVERGIASKELLRQIYPELETDISLEVRSGIERLDEKPYGLIFIEAPVSVEISDLHRIRGKFAVEGNPTGVGIRGGMRQIYRSLGSEMNEGYPIDPERGVNFLHSPDSVEGVMKVLNYAKESRSEAEFSVLFDKT